MAPTCHEYHMKQTTIFADEVLLALRASFAGIACIAFLAQFLPCASLHAQEQQNKVNVFVTVASSDANQSSEEELKAKRDDAEAAYEKFEADMKSQYKKRDLWPDDKKSREFELSHNAFVTEAMYEYRHPVMEDLQDSVQDIVESLENKHTAGYSKNVTVVSSAEDAHLLVEVIVRRAPIVTSYLGAESMTYVVCFRIVSGGKLDPASFGKIPPAWYPMEFSTSATMLKKYSSDNPYFTFETSSPARWHNDGSEAATLIFDFIKENGALLKEGNSAKNDRQLTPEEVGSLSPEELQKLEDSGDMKAPVLIQKVEPKYPEITRRAGIQGTVLLSCVIDREGNVVDVQVSKSLQPLLDQSAVDAVKQWKYQPATLYGKPVRMFNIVTVDFKLRAELTNQTIMELASQGLGEQNLIASIDAAKTVDFDLSAEKLKELLAHGVSNSVIAAMRKKQSEIQKKP